VAAIGGFLFGFDSGVINGTVSALGNAFNSSSVATGFNVASVLLGCAVGALAAGPLADRFGRRAIMIITGDYFLPLVRLARALPKARASLFFTAYLVV
jgi:Sugar (and other) transporter.